MKNENLRLKFSSIAANPIFIALLLVFLLSAYSVAASVSSVEISLSSTRATTGTSITASVTVTATGSESGSITLVVPSGVTIVDPSTGQYQGVSLSSTPTTKSFTIQGSTSGTYEISANSGGTTPNSPQTLVVVDPSTLTVSGSPSSTEKSSGDTFSLSITVNNPTSSAVTTSYKLSCPSGYSVSGDSSCDSTTTSSIGASSATTLSWTVTTGGSTGTLTFQLGSNTNAFSTSVTVPSSAGTTTTTTAAGAGTSGSSVATAVKVTKKYSSIIPEVAKAVTSFDLDQTDTQLTEILISVKNRVLDAEISIERLTSLPTNVPSPAASTYRIISIEQKNLPEENISSSKMKFKIEKSWITANGIDEKTVALYRLAGGKWNKLDTVKVDEDTKFVHFQATTPGFSYFVIGGEKLAAAAPAPSGEPTTAPTQPAPTEQAPTAPQKLPELPPYAYAIIVIIIAVIVVVVLAKKKIINIPFLQKL